MVTRKTQYAWMAMGGLLCLFVMVLACKLRDGNRAIAQGDNPPTVRDSDDMKAPPFEGPTKEKAEKKEKKHSEEKGTGEPPFATPAPTGAAGTGVDFTPPTPSIALPPPPALSGTEKSTFGPPGEATPPRSGAILMPLGEAVPPPPLPGMPDSKTSGSSAPSGILPVSATGKEPVGSEPSTPSVPPSPSAGLPPVSSPTAATPPSPPAGASMKSDKAEKKEESLPKKDEPLPPPRATTSPVPPSAPPVPGSTMSLDKSRDTLPGDKGAASSRPSPMTEPATTPNWTAPHGRPGSVETTDVEGHPLPGEPPLAPTPGPVQMYQVRGSETLQDVARRTLGNSARWSDIHKLNPTLKPDVMLKPGSTLRLPGDACVQNDESESIRPLPAMRPKASPAKVKTVLPLTGTYPCNLDDKKTMTLPRQIREQLGSSDVVLVSPGPDQCLWLTNQAHLERLAERLEQSPAREVDVRVFKRLYFAQTEKTPLSADGRVSIPERLAQFADLHQEVVLVGIDDHFELWDAARWKQYTQQKSSAARPAASAEHE
jgi:MraZ protein